MSLSLRTLAFLLVALACAQVPVAAQAVRGLAAWQYSGQTFLTWKSAGDGVKHYTVYRSRRPLRTALALQQAEEAYEVAPGQAYNARLSKALGMPAYYRLPGPGGTLDFTDEYFVITDGSYGKWYYAVMATGAKGEIRNLRPGRNSISEPVREYAATPSLVHQGRFQVDGRGVDVFVHWASNRAVPGTPAMSNLPMLPFNVGLRKNGMAAKHPLLVNLHGRGGNFLQNATGSGNPQEYILTLDDVLPGAVQNTFWLGYDTAMVVTATRSRPAPGTRVQPYTARRLAWTLRWALSKLPVDSARVMISGSSMGGTGAAFSIFSSGFRPAAALATIPRLDFGYRDASETPRGTSAFSYFDALWGPKESTPRMDDGMPVYEHMNFAARLQKEDLRSLPHLRIIAGSGDSTVGWKQVQPSVRTADNRHAGISFLWDARGHRTDGVDPWSPMTELISLSRYRSDRSWPAISGDADGDPARDAVGSSNARVDWFEPVLDVPELWSVGLRARPLEMRDSLAASPGTIVVDVTTRRLQRFVVKRGGWYNAVLQRDGKTQFQATVRAMRDGEVIVHDVPVTAEPGRLELRPMPGPVFDR